MLDRSKAKKVPILMYHSISQHATSKFRPFTVPPVLFADHMAYLYQHSYTPITVTQLIHARGQEGLALPAHPVVLTFDDGFADFFTDALPVLERYGFPATLYVTTAFIGGTSCWMRNEGEGNRPMLTWDQLTEISLSGIECGGHTHRHPQLDILPHAMAQNEIVYCKRLLEEHLGQDVLSFAYPHGYHSAAIQRLVREAGYTSACAVKYEMNAEPADPFALARLMVSAETSVNALAMLLVKHNPLPITTIYKRARIPMWRLVRRCSNWRRHYAQEGWERC